MRRCLTVSLVILLLVAAVGGGCEWYTARAVAAYRQALLPVEAEMAAGRPSSIRIPSRRPVWLLTIPASMTCGLIRLSTG